MLKYLFTLSFSFLLCLAGQSLFAQCEDGRYESAIFDSIIVTQDIEYGTNFTINGAFKSLKFDFYEPYGDTMNQRPLIIFAHGGSFVGGDENLADMVALCDTFARMGYVTASINYRLFDQFAIPDYEKMKDVVIKAMGDGKSAVRYFRKDAALGEESLYKVDPDHVYFGGASAGGVLAIHVAYLDTDENIPADVIETLDENGGMEGDSGNEGYSSEVMGVLNLCGAVIDTAWIQAGEEPIFSVHGTADETVPYLRDNVVVIGFEITEVDGSGLIHEHAEMLGIENDLITIDGGGHMAHLEEEYYPATIEGMASFMVGLVCVPEDTNTVSNYGPLVESLNMQIGPNPASDYFSINFQGLKMDQRPNIGLYNSNGQLLAKYESVNPHYNVFERNNLPSGIYFIQLESDEGSITKKLILK